MIEIGPLRPEDRAAWEVLARGYKSFYREPEPDEAYEQTWQRLAAGTEMHGLGARLDGRLAGIAHYLFHPAVWYGEACYLEDLFTDEAARGRGVARALIEGVAAAAGTAGRSGSTGSPTRPTPRLACSTTRWRASPGSSATGIPCSPARGAQGGGLTPSMNSPMPNR